MSTTPESTTDHLRYDVAQLEKMQQQIFSDMEALRTQEQNLRAYEARLRSVQPAPQFTQAPFAGQHEFDAERDKLARLRGLLEAERRSLVDERLTLRDEKAALALKADELRQREAWLEVREREEKVKTFAPPPGAKSSANPFKAARNFLNLGPKRIAS